MLDWWDKDILDNLGIISSSPFADMRMVIPWSRAFSDDREMFRKGVGKLYVVFMIPHRSFDRRWMVPGLARINCCIYPIIILSFHLRVSRQGHFLFLKYLWKIVCLSEYDLGSVFLRMEGGDQGRFFGLHVRINNSLNTLLGEVSFVVKRQNVKAEKIPMSISGQGQKCR